MGKKKTTTYILLKGILKGIITQLFGNKEYEKLVILGRQRTGSSLLMSLLRAHPNIDMKSEVFRLLKGKSCRTVWEETFSKKLPWIKYAGFKLFYNHPDDSVDREVWEILSSESNVRIIHIKRENVLRTYISKLIALKTGAWDSRQENGKLVPIDKRVHVNVEDCLNEMREIKRLEAEFGKSRFSNHQYLELSYEELSQNTDDQLRRINSFLGLQNKNIKNIKSNLKKQNPESLRELILNYDDFVKKINDSEFGHLLC